MALREEIKPLLDYTLKHSDLLAHNKALFNIYEGDLLSYVLEDLKNQLSPKSFQQIKFRVSPINILKKMIDKLSKIYAIPPIRSFGDNESDKELLSSYEKSMDINTLMGVSNEFFNLFKNTLIEPYLDQNGYPRLRAIPSDRFIVYSDNLIDPTHPTHVLKFMGKIKDKKIFYVYTDSEFLIIDEFGNTQQEMMNEFNNPDGINIYGKIPCVYVNRSRNQLIPSIDSDTLIMTKLIPVLLSDLNYAVMYQSFSVIYGIDVNVENLTMAPNALWDIKSDSQSDKKPEIGTIKPTVDIDQVVKFIKDQIALWFTTRNLKPGAIGSLAPDQAASGISKMIDEADTSEDREKQTQYFKCAETDLWNLIKDHMHPIWMRDPSFKLSGNFSQEAEFSIKFPPQKPIIDMSQTIDNMIKLKNAGAISLKYALKNIFSDLDDKDIEEIVKEAQIENTIEIPNGAEEIRSNDAHNS